MPPVTRRGQKATERTAQVGICTESEANAGGIFRTVESKEARSKADHFISHALSVGRRMRAIYRRYEAVGNPERKDDNSGTRFSWGVETGRWMDKSGWLKMKRRPGSGSSKGEVKASEGDKITGDIPITGAEGLRDSHGIQVLPMDNGESTAGADSGSPKYCPYDVISAPEEGPSEKCSRGEQSSARPKEPAVVKRQRSDDVSVSSPEIHRWRRDVALGANPVPKPGERAAKAEPVTQRKCALKTTTTLLLEITTRGSEAINRETVEDEPRANQWRQPQEPSTNEGGLAPRANIAPEPDQQATESPSKCGGTESVAPEGDYGEFLDDNHALLNVQGDEGESRRVLRSRSAGRGLPEGVVLEMDIFPNQQKEFNLPENKGEEPHAQETVLPAAIESGRASRWHHIAATPGEYPRMQPDRITRSRKNIPDAAPAGITSQAVRGEQVVASSAPEVQARSQTQDMVLEEGAEAKAPTSRKIKRKETSTPMQAETERRPKRIRRAPKWYYDY
ncbi:hypothetical protein RJZ57_006096 [Blastomyces gilchristii]